jgi:hypothetical protein
MNYKNKVHKNIFDLHLKNIQIINNPKYPLKLLINYLNWSFENELKQ